MYLSNPNACEAPPASPHATRAAGHRDWKPASAVYIYIFTHIYIYIYVYILYIYIMYIMYVYI